MYDDKDKFDDYYDRLEKRHFENLKMSILMMLIFGLGWGIWWLYQNFNSIL